MNKGRMGIRRLMGIRSVMGIRRVMNIIAITLGRSGPDLNSRIRRSGAIGL